VLTGRRLVEVGQSQIGTMHSGSTLPPASSKHGQPLILQSRHPRSLRLDSGDMNPSREHLLTSKVRRNIDCLFKAVSQFLWPDKDREVWFSLEENHKDPVAFPDFLHVALTEGNDVRLSLRKAACSSMAPNKLRRKSGVGLHQLRNCPSAAPGQLRA